MALPRQISTADELYASELYEVADLEIYAQHYLAGNENDKLTAQAMEIAEINGNHYMLCCSLVNERSPFIALYQIDDNNEHLVCTYDISASDYDSSHPLGHMNDCCFCTF